MIEETTVWRTDDGLTFPTHGLAMRHESDREFDALYGADEARGSLDGSTVEAEDMRQWLSDNKAMVLAWFKSQEE